MRIIRLALLSLALTACMVSAQTVFQPWIGQTDVAAVTHFGAPNREIVLADSSRVMTWKTDTACEYSLTSDRHGVIQSYTLSPSCPGVFMKGRGPVVGK